jgi:phage shock protein A
VTTINESVSGISKSVSDSGATLQRAQDKIATMQARAQATDELLESGVLEDVGGSTDDVQKELDQVSASSQIDAELAALKAASPSAIESGGGGTEGGASASGTGTEAPGPTSSAG